MKSAFTHLLGSCIVCGLAIVGYWVWYGMVEHESAQIVLLENQILTNAQTEKRVAAARASLSQIEGYETRIQNYFITETAVPSFIDTLQLQGEAQGTKISVLSVSKETVAGQSMLALALSIGGTFDAVMRTTGAIEYAPYAIMISGYSIQNDAANSWHASMTLFVGLSAPTASTTRATSTPPL